MQNFKKAILLSVAITLILGGCCLDFFKVSSLTLSHQTMRLSVGAEQEISVAIDQDKYLGKKEFSWSSSNQSVVSIKSAQDNKAILRAEGEGIATITVTLDDKSASCSVTAIKWNNKISKLTLTGITIAAGESATLEPYIEPVPPVDLKPSVLETLTWLSSDTNIATVDTKGVVTGIVEGEAEITVTSTLAEQSVKGKAVVKVIEESGSMISQDSVIISISPTELEIMEGSKFPLIVTTYPVVDPSNITFSSSDDTMVSVDANGVVEGLAAAKNITITAECYDKKATCLVSVLAASEVTDIDHIEISQTTSTVAVGQTKTFSVSVFPIGFGEASKFEWEVSPTTGATLNTNDNLCTFTATVGGQYTLTAKYPKADGSYATASCLIDVLQISSIDISDTEITLHTSETATINATILPAGVEGLISWESSNTAVATVSYSSEVSNTSSVTVTPVSDGDTIITAKCGSAFASCSVTVTNKVSELTLSTSQTVNLCVGEDVVLSAVPNVAPQAGQYTWTVEKPNIVTIATVDGSDYERKITGKAAGSTKIIVKADDIEKEFNVEVAAEGASSKMVEYLVKSGNFEYAIDNPTSAKQVYFVFTNTTNSNKSGLSVSSTGAAPTYEKLNNAPDVVNYERYQQYEKEFPYSTPASVTKFNDDMSVLEIGGPNTRPLLDATPSAVGDTKSFYALNSKDQTFSVESTLKLKRTEATAFGNKTLEIWVETQSFDDGLVTQSNVEKFANQFLIAGLNNDIYDYVTNIAGEEWGDSNRYSNLIPDNDKIVILLLDSSQGTGDSSYAGYFHSLHNLVRNDSNKELMFFIDCNSLDDSYQFNWRISTLAHEFQHMIHWYQKQIIRGVLSETWFNEMCSMAIEDIVATKLGSNPTEKLYSRMAYYLQKPNEQLTSWTGTSYDYAHSMMFGAYLLRNYGGAAALSSLIKSNAISLDDIPALLEKQNALYLLRRWGVAVLLSDVVINDVASYPEVSFKHDNGEITSTLGPITYTLKDLDFFSQRQYGGFFAKKGPDLSSGELVGAKVTAFANKFYYAGEVVPGKNYKWEINLPAGVEITIVKK